MRLLAGNLREAHELGMIDCDGKAIADYLTSINAAWNNTVDQDKEFQQGMRNTKREFDRQFRPIQAFRGRVIPFCNVMGMRAFSRHWLDTLEPGLGDPYAGHAKEQITKLANEATPASAVALARVQESFLRLNQWIKNAGGDRSRRGVTVSIGQLLDPAIRPFWVGGRVQKPLSSAQYWRDRLGLIDVSAGNRSCRDLLVRLRFVATMASEELPRTAHLEHRGRNPNSLWLFRPSVLHGGNRRFVQGVAADRAGRTARRGSTRDLSSSDYFEGERELLLLAGEIANSRLVGVDLLDGFADVNPGRDEDDHAFVESIVRQLAWA